MAGKSQASCLQFSGPFFNSLAPTSFKSPLLFIYKAFRLLLLYIRLSVFCFACSETLRSHIGKIPLPAVHLGNNSRKSSSSLQPDSHPLLVSAPRLCSVFESSGHLSMMSDALRKRGRESEAQTDSIDVREPKRFHGEETGPSFHLLQLDQNLVDNEQEEECAPSEELVNEVMKSLEEEIAATCSTSYCSFNSGDNSAPSDVSSNRDGQILDADSGIDLCYLLEASDDELGISPNSDLDLKEVCLSPKETSEGLSESSDLKSFGENWHFEEDFENYQQFAVYENAWDATDLQDYMDRDFVGQSMLFDGDFSEAWRLETTGGM